MSGRGPREGPLVSILLASRDGERYLEAALESLAAQSYPRLEVVAVDDGSRDRTGAILGTFAARRPDWRVVRTEGLGLAGALALAAGEARGELLARQDDDDLSHPSRIERQAAFLVAHPETAVVGTAAEIIDAAGRRQGAYPVPVRARDIRRMLRRAPPFVHGSVMMRRDVYREAGGYRAPFRASQDLDLWLRLPERAGLANLPETLYSWRLHPGGVFTRERALQLRFAALARAFADERRRHGADSIERLERSSDFELFLGEYRESGRLHFYLGEVHVREGRPREARRFLSRALKRRGARGAALLWWLLSFAVALTPRARRARRVSTGTAP